MRFHRALLRLYPASFRREYGPELEAVFAAQRREATGFLPVARLWIETVAEVTANASMVHGDILRQDLRLIGRTLRRSPGFALTAVLITALGVGANAAAFSVTDHALLRPLPFPEADRLVKLWQHPPGYTQMELSPANYRDWKEMSSTFETVGAFNNFAVNLVGVDEPERLQGALMTAEMFPILGIDPLIGRTFVESDANPASESVVVLSHSLWRNRFGADPQVLDRVITLDGVAHIVIGVMPPEFQFPTPASRLWVPLRLTEASYEDRNDNYLEVLARLNPGVSVEQVRAELAVVTQRLAALYPDANRDTGATVSPLRGEYSNRSRLLLLGLAGASVCILLIACANLGSLLLARGLARERELAVRTALGAGRERLVRQLVTESLVIAGAGSVVGILAAMASLPMLARLVPATLPLASGPVLDLRVLGTSIALTLVTSLAFTVFPARRTAAGSGFTALRVGGQTGDRRKERLRGALVAVEVAGSVVLLIAAGLLLRAIDRINQVDPGFASEGILTVRTALPSPRYDQVAARSQFYGNVLAGMRAQPGVTGAAFVSAVPLVWGGGIWPATVEGETGIRDVSNTASMRFISPGYFATMEIPLLDGRDVAEGDRQDTPFVAVVSESFAERYWPGQSALDRTFRMAFSERRIVGVVADIRMRGLEREAEPQVYFPAPQVGDGSLIFYWPKDLVVQTTGNPLALVAAVRRAVRAADPEQPVSDIRAMSAILEDQTASRTVQVRILVVLSAIALLLAAVGIHGVLSYMVSQRRREIGLRMALGAQAPSVVRMVARQGMWLVLAGVAPGIALALLAGRAMQAVLFGVPAFDPLTLTVVVALCVVMAVAGCVLPALRAARVDPIRALKAE